MFLGWLLNKLKNYLKTACGFEFRIVSILLRNYSKLLGGVARWLTAILKIHYAIVLSENGKRIA